MHGTQYILRSGLWKHQDQIKGLGLFLLCPRHQVAKTYSVAHVRNSEIKQFRPLFFRYALRYWLDIWYVGV